MGRGPFGGALGAALKSSEELHRGLRWEGGERRVSLTSRMSVFDSLRTLADMHHHGHDRAIAVATGFHAEVR